MAKTPLSLSSWSQATTSFSPADGPPDLWQARPFSPRPDIRGTPSLCSVLPKTIEIPASRASLAKAVTAENGAGAWLCLFAASYLCSHQVRGHEENERILVSETQ